jgi:hypothetical protein
MSHPSVILEPMNDQLALLEEDAGTQEPAWELDDHTREVGRRGVAAARDALRQATRRAA